MLDLWYLCVITTPNCAFIVGFNVETVAYKGINFITWDVGSRIGSVSCIVIVIILVSDVWKSEHDTSFPSEH